MAFGIHMILEMDAVSSIFKNFKLISETIEDKTSEYIKGFKEIVENFFLGSMIIPKVDGLNEAVSDDSLAAPTMTSEKNRFRS